MPKSAKQRAREVQKRQQAESALSDVERSYRNAKKMLAFAITGLSPTAAATMLIWLKEKILEMRDEAQTQRSFSLDIIPPECLKFRRLMELYDGHYPRASGAVNTIEVWIQQQFSGVRTIKIEFTEESVRLTIVRVDD